MAAAHHIERPPDVVVYDHDHRGRLYLAALVGFGLLALVAALAGRVTPPGGDDAASFAGAEVTPAKPIPTLALQRTDGTAWTSAETEGRLALFFFGYTNCPDICPLTLSRARQVYDALGAEAGEVDVYFITVDPARDTPERLARYVSQFNPEFTALSGTPEQLEAAQAAFGVVAVQQPGTSDSGYAVDHTASSYLVDRAGRIRLIYPHDAPSDDVLTDIQTLLGE